MDDTPEQQLDRFSERRQAFQEAHRKLVVAIDNNSPFYPAEIYQALDRFRIRTAVEVSQLQTRKPFANEWFDQREDAQRAIESFAEVVSFAIRQRLASIVIQEGPGLPLPEVTVEADQLPAPSED